MSRSIFVCNDWPIWRSYGSCFPGSYSWGYGIYSGAAIVEYPYVEYPYVVDDSVDSGPVVVEQESAPPSDQERTEPEGVAPGTEDARVADLLEQGEKAFQTGRYDVAREHFDRAMQLAPDDPRSRVSFGICEFALGNFGDAASAIHDAMAMAPDLAATPLDLRKGFGNSKSFQTQIDLLENLTRARPDDSRFRLILGFVQYFSGQPSTGIETLRSYTSAHPEDAAVRSFVETADNASKPPQQQSPTPRPKSGASRPPATNGAPPQPIGAKAPWDDGALNELAIAEFSHARHLDPLRNRIGAEITATDVDKKTGALRKAKFNMHWVEWKARTDKNGLEVAEGKQKKDTVKVKFDEWGHFAEYAD